MFLALFAATVHARADALLLKLSATSRRAAAPRLHVSGEELGSTVHDADARCEHLFPRLWHALAQPRQDAPEVWYSCPTGAGCGGLGDRLAGVVSVAAWGLAAGRRVRVHDPRLALAFEGVNATLEPVSGGGGGDTLRCELGHRPCSMLERPPASSSRRLVVPRLHRAWLCRWVSEQGPVWLRQRLATFGLNASSDLFGAAGCMLRATLRPRPTVLQRKSEHRQAALRWVGVHLRTLDVPKRWRWICVTVVAQMRRAVRSKRPCGRVVRGVRRWRGSMWASWSSRTHRTPRVPLSRSCSLALLPLTRQASPRHLATSTTARCAVKRPSRRAWPAR